MQDLTPVGLSRDGRRLLLVSSSGEDFSLPVDTRLRALLRGDHARLGQLEMKMESALRPRDIQARIRGGESPEEVAAAAQTTVEAIMTFANPVLAERAHVAQTALKASVRRRSGESSSAGRSLGEAAEVFFGDHSLHDEDVDWDAWRRPDGRWALVARYQLADRPRTAEFTHDLPGRYVIAENDEARMLTGELREPDSRQPSDDRAPTRRLSSVPSQDELPLGDDAIELVRDRAPEGTDASGPESGPETGRETGPETGPATSPGPAVDTADADWMITDPITHEQRDAGPILGSGPEVDQPALDIEVETSDPAPSTGPSDEPGNQSGNESGEQPAPKKKSRSSVPSWDEIMFGGKSE